MNTPERDLTFALDFAKEAERITNNAQLDKWVALYAHDAICEWTFDGIYTRREGIDEIRAGAAELAAVWTARSLRVRKHLEAATSETITLTWTGGFHGRNQQQSIETWTISEGKVVRHLMHGFLHVHPAGSARASLRLMVTSPAVAYSILRYRLRHS